MAVRATDSVLASTVCFDFESDYVPTNRGDVGAPHPMLSLHFLGIPKWTKLPPELGVSAESGIELTPVPRKRAQKL